MVLCNLLIMCTGTAINCLCPQGKLIGKGLMHAAPSQPTILPLNCAVTAVSQNCEPELCSMLCSHCNRIGLSNPDWIFQSGLDFPNISNPIQSISNPIQSNHDCDCLRWLDWIGLSTFRTIRIGLATFQTIRIGLSNLQSFPIQSFPIQSNPIQSNHR